MALVSSRSVPEHDALSVPERTPDQSLNGAPRKAPREPRDLPRSSLRGTCVFLRKITGSRKRVLRGPRQGVRYDHDLAPGAHRTAEAGREPRPKIGRASCRERV